jgi:uncharacterized repeat protein (TIGR01451 family)
MSTFTLPLCRATKMVLAALVAFATAGPPAALADPASPINVSHVDSPDPVISGSQLTYTTTITNLGGAKITNVSLSNQVNGVGGIGVPPQLVLTSTRGSCTQNVNLVTCNAGTIEGGGSWTVTIRGVVTASAGTTLNNTVGVTGTKSAQTFNTTTTTTTLVSGGAGQLPDLTIAKTGPTTVRVNTPMTYTLTVNNIGTLPTSGVKVVDTVPAGLTAITASGTSLFTCGVVGQTVTCTGGLVNQGSNATITINATSPAVVGTITNNAVVDPDDAIVEINNLNNTSALVNTQVTTGPPAPDLSINLTDSSLVIAGAGPDPVNPGATLTYKILVTNTHPTRADDVEMVNGTQGLEAASITVTQEITNGTEGQHGGCEVLAPQVRCRIQKLQPGGTVLYTIRGQVVASAGSTILDTATVTGNIQNTGVSSTDTELTTVKPDVDLTITKSDSPDPVCARSWPAAVAPTAPPLLGPPVCLGGLTYTMVVGNSGINPALGVTVRDPLPMGTVFHSFVAPSFFGGCAVNPATNVLTCTGGVVAAESTTTITVVLVAPPYVGTISNTATVDPNNAIFEADETNNIATESTVVSTGIDLTILKTDVTPGFDPIATSGTQTYTITVDNLGTQDATNIRVRDTLPANTRFRSVVGDNGFSCSHSNGVVECFGGSILGTAAEFYPPFGAPGNDTATIVIRVFAQPNVGTGVDGMHNEARVDPLNEIAEVNEANNIEFEDTDVVSGDSGQGAFNQLTIVKTQPSPANPVARNAVVTYNLAVSNKGTDPAVGVTVRDFLPAGARYITATGQSFICSELAAFIQCVGGQIQPGATVNITLKAFAPDTPGFYTNQAVVDPDNAIPEGNEFDNESSVQIEVRNAGNGPFHELTIAKTRRATPADPVARNAVVTYDIVVHNNGTDGVNGITVRDFLPVGSRLISALATPATQFLCTEGAGSVECVGGQIAGSGGAATITVQVYAPDTPGTYTNQALVDPANAIPEGDEQNNADSETIEVADGGNGAYNDLTISKTAKAIVTPNETFTYTLTVTNGGSNAALNVAVRDVLPAQVTFVSADDGAPGAPGAFTCSGAGGVVNCIGGTLNGSGGVRTIQIVVKAPNLTGVSLTNQAIADPDNEIPEGSETNNTFEFVNTVTSNVNLEIVKTGPKTSSQNQVTDYKITVTNHSPSGSCPGASCDGQTVFGVHVHDPLPVGLIPLDIEAGGNFACAVLENPINVVDCVGDLDPDVPVEIRIGVFMTAETSRSLDNEACIDPADVVKEFSPPGESDNCSTHSNPVGPPAKRSPDFLVSKSVDKSVASPGDTLEYTITVTNNGDANAKGVITVTDNLPDQTTAVDISGPNLWTCSAIGDVMTCTNPPAPDDELPVGGTVQITVHATVNAGASLPLVNTATASAALADPAETDAEDETVANQANNTATANTGVGSAGFDLSIGSITDNPDPANAGKLVTYTVVAVNGGSQAAPGVHVNVTLPSNAAATFVSADGTNGFNCAAPVGTLVDCVGDLPAGGNTVITIKLVVVLAPPGDLVLSAVIDPADAFEETNDGNNTQTETTTVSGSVCTACVDLVSVLLSATPEPAAPSGSITFKYVLVNAGDMPTDFLSGQKIAHFDFFGGHTGFTLTSSDPTAVDCTSFFSDATREFNDCVGNLGAGQGVTLTATISGVAAPDIRAFATADPGNVITEFKEDNNALTETVVVE